MKKYLIVIVSLLGLLIVNACKKDKAPTAAFDFSLTCDNYIVPCQVLFDNKSDNTISYKWNFGDGTNSSEKNPAKTYNVAGYYTVTLRASGKGGDDTISKQILIGRPKPIVKIQTLYDTIGLPSNVPQPVVITNVGPQGSILDYLVTDGDGFLDVKDSAGSLPSGNSATVFVLVKPNTVPGYWDINGNFWGRTTSVNVRTPNASNYLTIPVSVAIVTVTQNDTYMHANINGQAWHYCTSTYLSSYVGGSGITHIGESGAYSCDPILADVKLEIHNLNGTGTYYLTPSSWQGDGWYKPSTSLYNFGTNPNGSGTVTITRFDAIYIEGTFNFIAEYQGSTANISNGFFKVRRF